MLKIFKKIWRFYEKHLDVMMLPFKGIVNNINQLEKIKTNFYRWHYFIPFALITGIGIDTAIQYSIHGYDTKNPVLFNHVVMKFLPEFYLSQGDWLFPIVGVMIIIMNFFLLFDKMSHFPFIMLKSENSHNWKLIFPYRKKPLNVINKSLGIKLVKFYEKFLKQIKKLISFLTFQMNLAYAIPLFIEELYHVVISKGSYFPSLRIIVCNITVPFFTRYVLYGTHIGVHFMASNYMIQIKQKHYLSSTHPKKLFRVQDNCNEDQVFKKVYQKWRKYLERILDVTREIKGFNNLYSKYITTIIVCFGMASCTIVNAVIMKADSSQFIQNIPWVVFGLFYSFIIFIFCAFSSRTIYLNVCLFKRLRHVQIILLSKKCLNRLQIVKLDLVNEYKLLLQKCSFRLLNSSQINNKLFAFEIFACVTGFYMKLVKDGKKEGLL